MKGEICTAALPSGEKIVGRVVDIHADIGVIEFENPQTIMEVFQNGGFEFFLKPFLMTDSAIVPINFHNTLSIITANDNLSKAYVNKNSKLTVVGSIGGGNIIHESKT